MKSTQNKRRSALLMDVRELAELLGVAPRTVWAWEAAGKVPAALRKGRHWTRWRRADVEAWVAEGMGDCEG